MINFTTGNLLKADAEALVNTVNTVGVMGKGIALMFKEAFPANFLAYNEACKSGDVTVGKVHVFDRGGFFNPRYIINFPTKKHWRHPSKMEWIKDGLKDLKKVIEDLNIRSVAIPPLGAGNGKLEWSDVREQIENILGDMASVDILVFEPVEQYQNVSKRDGAEKLTPARAIMAELIRRYLVLGIECTMLEVQKLAWFAERLIQKSAMPNVLDLQFSQNRYGPYAHRLSHMLNSIDGSYIHCSKRIADASPSDTIWFEYQKSEAVAAYLRSEGKSYLPIISWAEDLIDGFESPLGLELLSTIDWIINIDKVAPTLEAVRNAVAHWPGGDGSGKRKARLFEDRLIWLAIERLTQLDRIDNSPIH